MQKSFKSLFSIYSLQNFVVVDNQNTQLKKLHRLLFQVTGEAVTCLVYPRFLHENSMYSIENRLSYFFAKRII